jgi:hypothetical protein
VSAPIRWVTGWLCFACGHWTPPGHDKPQDCCDAREAVRAGFRTPDQARMQ